MSKETKVVGSPKRWSASRKKDVVMRLLRGEEIDEVSREVGVAMSTLEGGVKWKGTFFIISKNPGPFHLSNPIYFDLTVSGGWKPTCRFNICVYKKCLFLEK